MSKDIATGQWYQMVGPVGRMDTMLITLEVGGGPLSDKDEQDIRGALELCLLGLKRDLEAL